MRSKILLLVFGTAFCLRQGSAFSIDYTRLFSSRVVVACRESTTTTTTCYNWLGDLWEEVIEFSTYGPSERRMLKERREKAAAEARAKEGGDVSMDSFQRAQQKFVSTPSAKDAPISSNSSSSDEDSLSLGSFQAAVASKEKMSDEDMDYDGYKLRDLIVETWGAPLDVDFQRGNSGQTVYCTVLPVAFGSSRCRHSTELDYLMHLQGIVEVLQKYDNLDSFLFFVQTTKRTPKPGVESAPYKMQLDEEALRQIL